VTAAVIPSTAVAKALAAIDVRSSTSYSWFGDVTDLPEQVVRLGDRRALRSALVVSISSRLYDCFYTQGAPRRATSGNEDHVGVGTLSHDLAQANEGSGYLEAGWRVVGEEDERLVVERAGLRLWVTEGEIAGPAAIDGTVSVRLPADLPAYSPGFYTARGDRSFAIETPRIVDRFYLDLRPEGAVPFVSEATRRLNREGLPFVAKVVDDPDGFERRDAAVLAVERRDRSRALPAAQRIRTALAPYLDGGAPALTLPLAPGLAFAEDPGGGESFGRHRCLLIADAAVVSAERGLRHADDRLEIVSERFLQAGTSLDAPYRGSPDGAVIVESLAVAGLA
jgi:hypothetical protein